jgi:transcriptional regulator with XRE-family HTH domain
VRSHDIDETVKNVGRRVAELRGKAGLTQEQQAERLGFTLKYLQRIEGGGENLTVRSLVKIASAFGVPVTELFRRPRTTQAGPGRPKRKSAAARTRSKTR